MPSRHESRERALQMLFLWDQNREAPDKVAARYWGGLWTEEPAAARPQADEFANQLLHGTVRSPPTPSTGDWRACRPSIATYLLRSPPFSVFFRRVFNSLQFSPSVGLALA